MLGSIRAAAILAAALCSAHAAGQDGEAPEDDDALDRTPQDCITVSRIDETDVIDDNTIVFHMRGDDAFVNYLPDRCPNLARENSFAYEVRTSQLCNVQTITVLEDSGRLPGFTCRLGEFHPVTAAEIAELERLAEEGSRDELDIEQVEPPEDDAETDDEGAADDVGENDDGD